MSERLTETLVRQGQLSPEAAQAAVERQVLMGGALDTALLEIGVDESLVMSAFREAYDAPMADLSEVEAPGDERAVRSIPEQWARRHRLAPISMEDDGTLTVLSPAPADLELLVRLSDLLDLRIKPRLALETQVVQRLSRLYGIRPPDRFVPLVSHRPSGGPPLEPLTFTRAMEALRRAEHRDQVGRALLGFALRELAFGALFVVGPDHLRGWMGFGPGAHVVPDKEIPVSDPSAVRMVIDSQGHYLGPQPEDGTQLAICQNFGRQNPRTVVIAPIRLKGRTVALLYGENGPDPIPGRLAGDLMLLVTHVQVTLEGLVLRQKGASVQPSPPTSAPAPPAVHVSPASPTAEASRTEELPDEPIYPEEPEDDDDWEPVAVRRQNFVEGVELTAPEVVPSESELPEPQAAVVTAPQSSRDVPNVTVEVESEAEPTETPVADSGESAALTLTSELAPRSVLGLESADVPIEAPDLVGADSLSQATTASGARASTRPGANRVSLEAAAQTVPDWDELEDADDTWEPALGPDTGPSEAGDSAALEPATEDLEEELWDEEGRDLVQRLMDGSPEPEVPASDVHWDVVEPSAWSEPNLRPGQEEPSPSQPYLLTDRLPTPASAAPAGIMVEAEERTDPERAALVDVDGLVASLEDPASAHRLREVARTVLPQLAEHIPGPGVVDPFQRRSVPRFEECGPLLSILAELGSQAHPFVSRGLENPDPKVRFYATHFYSAVPVPEAIPRLIQRLHDEEPRICMVAARTLFGYRDHPDFTFVLDHLHGRLNATSHAARRHAAYLIGLFRDVTAIPKLIEILERRDRAMIDVTLDALAEITKQRLGNHPRRWRQWLEKNRERSRILWLIDGLSAKEENLRRSAAEELRAVTGRNFGFEHDAPRRRRDEARNRWMKWWEDEGRAQLGA